MKMVAMFVCRGKPVSKLKVRMYDIQKYSPLTEGSSSLLECLFANLFTMSTEVQQQIQQDWENREFIEIVSEGIKKIAEFLNDFGELKLLSIICN